MPANPCPVPAPAVLPSPAHPRPGRSSPWAIRVLSGVLTTVVLACGGDSSAPNNPSSPPAAPSGLAATAASNSAIDLSWTDNAADETGFRVEQAPGGTTTFSEIGVAGANVTSYQSTGLAAGTAYAYRVRAYNGDGSSGNSNVATATTQGGTPGPYTLTVARGGTGTGTVTGSGITCGVTCSTTVASGTSITLTATPAAGSSFVSWANCNTPSGTTCTMAMTADKTVTATFNTITPGPYTLTVAKAGTGTGTVTGSGITCGTTCSTTVASGTSITLTATPAVLSTFTSWTNCDTPSGATCTMAMTASKTVTATFNTITPATYTLTVAKAGTGSGTVTGSGITCGTTCSTTAVGGTSITLTAAPAAGSSFTSWTNCDTPSGATCTMGMTADKTVTATFTTSPVNYTLTVAKAGTGSGTVTGSGITCGVTCSTIVVSGTSITLTAAPAAGSSFTSWTNCDTPSGTTCTMAMTASKTVTATFTAAASPSIALSATSLTFSATQGGTNPAAQVVNVTNGGGGTLTGLSIAYPSGTPLWVTTILAGFTAPVTVTVLPQLSGPFGPFSPGTYTATLEVRSTVASNSPRTVSITFTILPPGQTTITLKPQYDNLVMVSSADNTVANRVYSNAWLSVGCVWDYWPYTGQGFVCGQGLMRFDLSALAGKTIVSATLKLTVRSTGVGYYPQNWHLRALASTWSPSTVTWNVVANLQYYTASQLIQAPPTYSGQIYNLDLTTHVKNWVGQTWQNYGLILGSENYTFPNATSFDAFDFWSLEDPAGAWPGLTITYQ